MAELSLGFVQKEVFRSLSDQSAPLYGAEPLPLLAIAYRQDEL